MKLKVFAAKYAGAQIDKASNALLAYCHTGEAEDLHRFRVACKRLFMIYTVNEGYVKTTDLQLILNWKSAFKVAGWQRALELEERLVSRFSSLGKARSDSESNPGRIKSKLRASLHLLKESRKELVAHSGNAGRRQWDSYLKKQADRLYTYLLLDDLNFWHDARKCAKRMLYGAELYSAAGKKSAPIPFRVVLDQLQDSIGEWHDLNLFRSNYPNLYRSSKSAKVALTKADAAVRHSVRNLIIAFEATGWQICRR